MGASLAPLLWSGREPGLHAPEACVLPAYSSPRLILKGIAAPYGGEPRPAPLERAGTRSTRTRSVRTTGILQPEIDFEGNCRPLWGRASPRSFGAGGNPVYTHPKRAYYRHTPARTCFRIILQ